MGKDSKEKENSYYYDARRERRRRPSSIYLKRVTSAREKMTVIVTMDGNVQDVRIFIEDLLGSITVMDVLNTS